MAGSFILAGTSPAVAAPANDAFAAAQPISGADGAVYGSNVGATKEPGEPSHADNPGGASVWYTWTAPVHGQVEFMTWDSSFDTLLAIYTGSSVTGLVEIGSNDDCDGGSRSCVVVDASMGTTYKIAVDGYGARTGTVGLHWSWNDSDCTVHGTAGNDVLTGTAGNDVICGFNGNDVLKGQGGDDTIKGGAGTDKVDFANASRGVVVNLIMASATGQGSDFMTGVEGVDGSPYADRIDGDYEANQLAGKGGADSVYGQGGNDQVWGGDGADTVGGGDGDDRIAGGPGVDTAKYGLPAVVDLIQGTASGQGADTIKEVENLIGSTGADWFRGSGLANYFQGGAGNDILLGEGGNDRLLGQDGNDALTGHAGTDTCDGGPGSDTATTCERRTSIP